MAFKDTEKQRQTALKPELFSEVAQPAGHYGKNGPYDFCLAGGRSAENLHEAYRDDVIEYFRARDISWHDGCPDGLPSSHLCSSQCACINALGPMIRDEELLAAVFGAFLPELAEPLPFTADRSADGTCPWLVFEWPGTKNYLNEKVKSWPQRGRMATNADFAFRFKRHDGHVQLVLGEWKYVESYSGQSLSQEVRGPIYHDAFLRWRNTVGTDGPDYETFFAEPIYQFMRQALLAKEMELARKDGAGEMEADIVTVLHVSPDANHGFALSLTSPVFAQYGATVTDAWKQIAGDERFKAISSESLLTAIERLARPEHGKWVKWLLGRYGWWRS